MKRRLCLIFLCGSFSLFARVDSEPLGRLPDPKASLKIHISDKTDSKDKWHIVDSSELKTFKKSLHELEEDFDKTPTLDSAIALMLNYALVADYANAHRMDMYIYNRCRNDPEFKRSVKSLQKRLKKLATEAKK